MPPPSHTVVKPGSATAERAGSYTAAGSKIKATRMVYTEGGGFPPASLVMLLGESQLRPSAVLFRNLASMDRNAASAAQCPGT